MVTHVALSRPSLLREREVDPLKPALTLLAVAVALAVALPAPARADLPDACPDDRSCVVKVENNDPCGKNVTKEGQVQGETCVRRARASAWPVRGPAPVTLVAESESANGNVSLANTPNLWASERLTVQAGVALTTVTVESSGLLSTQTPGRPASTGQVYEVVTVTVNGASHGAGLRVLSYDGAPRWCILLTPAGTFTLDCSGDAARVLAVA